MASAPFPYISSRQGRGPVRVASVIVDIATRSLDGAFTYSVPTDCASVQVGCAVLVGFGKRRAVGYVTVVEDVEEDDVPHAVRPILSVLSEPYFDEDGAALVDFLASRYVAPPASCARLLTPAGRRPTVSHADGAWVLKRPPARRAQASSPAATEQDPPSAPPALTEGQEKAVRAITRARKLARGDVVVVDGVTGSGKTEVYLRAIADVLAQGRGAIALVPEISLTPQTVARFEARFGSTVAVMHSNMTQAERFDQWKAARDGVRRIVVGPRSALFAPVRDLGLIIIDEEHESTYKQESAPRYHARDVAAWIARRRGIPLVLGSATPSIEALDACAHDELWHRVSMPDRVNGRPLPDIRIVDMAREFGSGSRMMFSRELSDAIVEVVDAGRKVVLMLNKRGFASFLLCRECGFVPECPTCSVSLTYHEVDHALVCHHCGRRLPVPPACPRCSSPYLKKFGAGTQRVESELGRLLEGHAADVIRMDSDTTSSRGAHARLLKRFSRPGASVLLGTQMIAKGLDFDDVTVVGVINADTQLALPDFRSGERTFDLIEQVAGRAGRGRFPGRVFVQTYAPEDAAISCAARYDRSAFLSCELGKRKVLGYPPYARVADVRIWGASEQEVRACAHDVAGAIAAVVADARREQGDARWQTLGAAPCTLGKLRGMHRWHVLVKAPPASDISSALASVLRPWRTPRGVSVAVDVDPQSIL